MIGEGYLETIGIPFSRDVDSPAQTSRRRRRSIINETLALQLWPNEDALGKRFVLPRPEFTQVVDPCDSK